MLNNPTIKKEEFSQRIENFRRVMARDNLDLVVGFSNLLDPSTVRYFSDFSAVNESAAIIIPLDGETIVCSGQASYDYALIQNKLPGSVIKVFPEIGEVSGFEYDFEGQLDFSEIFTEIKKSHKVKRIGIIGKLIFPAIILDKLRSKFDDSEIINYDKELYEIRVIKSDDEIACIKKGSEIISLAFEAVIPEIRVGMTERNIQGLFDYNIMKLDAESTVQAFSPMVATGDVNSHISMCRNTTRKVQEGEILNLAAGACYEGYNGIICSPYVLGTIPQKMKDAIKCAYEALNIASGMMKIGTPAGVVLNAYTDYLTKKGYIDYCPYGSLHSTGLLECEAPIFTIENGRVIEENMTICIDAYFKGMEWGSFRVEDNYVITKNGAERMTSYNDKFLPELFK